MTAHASPYTVDDLRAFLAMIEARCPDLPFIRMYGHAIEMYAAADVIGDPAMTAEIRRFVEQLMLGLCRGLSLKTTFDGQPVKAPARTAGRC